MTKRFPGNLIDPDVPTVGGPGYEGLAPGMWSLASAMRYKEQGVWPTQDLVTAGQAAYATSGTYTFVAPAGITNVSAVTIGSGSGNGGGGGELRYRTSMTVVPGNSYSVVVGAQPAFSTTSPWANGGLSQFVVSGSSVCRGNGGIAGPNGNIGGSGGLGDGGGNGGVSGNYGSSGYYGYRSGGAGAGGYSGTGGTGGTYTNSTTFNGGTSGSGGAGGGGCSSANGSGWGGSASSGGGTGLGGAGANGAGAPSKAGGPGISPAAGSPGSPFQGQDTGYTNFYAGAGGGYLGTSGAVRIIWGGTQVASRSFPSTNTGDYNV